jgi:hypothetical protein
LTELFRAVLKVFEEGEKRNERFVAALEDIAKALKAPR